MLFDLKTAIQIKNYYKNVLIGQQLTPTEMPKINRIYICKKGDATQGFVDYINMRDEDYKFLNKYGTEKQFEIYVAYDDGSNLVTSELDKNLDLKGMDKIYSQDNLN